MKRIIQVGIVALFCQFMLGCSAVYTSMSKSEIVTETKMSDTVFLEPVSSAQRTVFVQIKNTSDQSFPYLDGSIKSALNEKGYTITDNPDNAHYWLQANVLNVVMDNGEFGEEATARGFGGAISGAAVGSAFGKGSGRAASTIAGAAIGMAMNAAIKDVYYTVVTDIQISVRLADNKTVEVSETSSISQGRSGKKETAMQTQSDRKQIQTRVVSIANKSNLTFDEAKGPLSVGLVRSISGIF